jgi:hypothetical protein
MQRRLATNRIADCQCAAGILPAVPSSAATAALPLLFRCSEFDVGCSMFPNLSFVIAHSFVIRISSLVIPSPSVSICVHFTPATVGAVVKKTKRRTHHGCALNVFAASYFFAAGAF